jgi:hypothetical protein
MGIVANIACTAFGPLSIDRLGHLRGLASRFTVKPEQWHRPLLRSGLEFLRGREISGPLLISAHFARLPLDSQGFAGAQYFEWLCQAVTFPMNSSGHAVLNSKISKCHV